MTNEELAALMPGEKITLDLTNLWGEEYEREGEGIDSETRIILDDSFGQLVVSYNDGADPDEPYLDIYTENGPVACDGETCEVIFVDEDAEIIELKSEDCDFDATFTLSFVDAIHCVNPTYY